MPELQEVGKKLWSKNIETFMVSNDDDNHLYILMEDLSDQNMERLNKLMESYPEYYFFDEYRHYYGIKTEGTTKEDSQILLKLTELFIIQYVLRNRYQTAEEFLENKLFFNKFIKHIDAYYQLIV